MSTMIGTNPILYTQNPAAPVSPQWWLITTAGQKIGPYDSHADALTNKARMAHEEEVREGGYSIVWGVDSNATIAETLRGPVGATYG